MLAGWQARGVANADKLDETTRTLIAYGVGRQSGTPPYTEFFAYWMELRAAFDAEVLIDSWDTLWVLNYLDHRIDGFAPGDAFRDAATPVAEIEYDLDDFAGTLNASRQARKGAEQVANGIQGKVPRGRARATACLSMELLLRPVSDRAALIARFGIPQKPRQWQPLGNARRAQLIEIAASFDKTGRTGARAARPATPAVAVTPFAEVEFASALRPAPRPTRNKRQNGNGGSKKIDYRRRQDRNTEIGHLCEEFALAYERWRLASYPSLAAKVERVSLDDDTLGYDIKSFETDGRDRLLEVRAPKVRLQPASS